MRFVYHVDNETAHLSIDGRLISIPPNELFEVPELRGNHFNNNGPCEYIITEAQMVQHITEQGWYHGIVEVPVRKSKTGMDADVEAARTLAQAALDKSRDQTLADYISEQRERQTVQNLAPLAPMGRVLKIIEARGIDLEKDFNLAPPGYAVHKQKSREAEIEELRRLVGELQKTVAAAVPGNGAKDKRSGKPAGSDWP
jgi:hypothetical protein